MKIFCKVHKKNAVVVGYGPGRKGRIRAIVIVEGRLRDVALRDVELPRDADELTGRNMANTLSIVKEA